MYGIGATKAGTSWLHDYLVSHPEVATPPRKELHYFDGVSDEVGLYTPASLRALIEAEMAELRDRMKNADDVKTAAIKFRLSRLRRLATIYQDDAYAPEVYRAYMQSEIDRTGAKLVTDITPAYGLLSGKWLARMATLAPVTRFVYVLRDPVDRLWSNIRMTVLGETKSEGDFAARCCAAVDTLLQGKRRAMLRRSNYAQTLEQLEQSVPLAQRCTLFFETMFSQDAMDELCAFLGLCAHPAQVLRPAHVGVSMKLDETRRAGLSQLLAPQYAAVEARFGALPDRWQQNMTKV